MTKLIEVGTRILVLILLAVAIFNGVLALPQGATIISTTTEDAAVRSAANHVAAGGSFTTLVLNVTSQTSSWKAYVGNVTGKVTLDNSQNKTIYDWALTVIQGEVYVSRNESVLFGSLTCASLRNISVEETALSINVTNTDSINNTFRQKIHRSFVVGGTGVIANSTCFAIATYINDANQTITENADFQEVLLSDGRNLVYTTLLENRVTGFDSSSHDFQLIVPDDPTQVSTTYYFYAELG